MWLPPPLCCLRLHLHQTSSCSSGKGWCSPRSPWIITTLKVLIESTISCAQSIGKKVGFDQYSHLRMASLSSLKVSMWTTASQRWEQGRQAAKVASRLMLIFPAGFLRSLQSINKEPSPNSKGGKHRESIMPKLTNLEMYLKQGGEGTEERKVVIHLRSQAVVDPGPLNHISSYILTLTWILPGLNASSCTDRLNPTLTPRRDNM